MALLTKLKLKFIAVGAILLGLFALYQRVKNKGKEEARNEINAETLEATLESAKKTKKVHERVRDSSDADIDKSLSDRLHRHKGNSKRT